MKVELGSRQLVFLIEVLEGGPLNVAASVFSVGAATLNRSVFEKECIQNLLQKLKEAAGG